MITYPKTGEVFELSMDGDLPENQPIMLARLAGWLVQGQYTRHIRARNGDVIHKTVTDFEFRGRVVHGMQTKRFQLVQKGGTWDEIGRVIGSQTACQWLLAFRSSYPDHDGCGMIAVHDLSIFIPWRNEEKFPAIAPEDRRYFRLFDNPYDRRLGDRSRWLVEIE